MPVLSGKVAIVTGAARGIGLAIATRFVDDGAQVLIVDIAQEAGRKAAEALGSNCRFLRADITSASDVQAALAEACSAFTGDIDVLVNNAAIIHTENFLTISDVDFTRVMDVNVRGQFLMSQAVARKMVEQVKAGRKPGSIVSMSSIAAVLALDDQVPYCTSKAALGQLTKVMCLALAPYGIRANAIGPGSIKSDMFASVATSREVASQSLSRTPMQRFGETREIASVASFLASDDSTYLTGQTIYVDGGRTSLNYTVPVLESALPAYLDQAVSRPQGRAF